MTDLLRERSSTVRHSGGALGREWLRAKGWFGILGALVIHNRL